MARSSSFGKIEFVACTDEAGAPAELVRGIPFRIGVLGDFSGRANRGLVEAGPCWPHDGPSGSTAMTSTA